MHVLLIAGGWSSEREVSLSGARGIRAALARLGHDIEDFDPAARFDQLAERAAASDFAFLNLHGAPGEDGLIQAMLDRVGCPYQGAGPAGSFLALGKAAAKQLFRRAGLATPDWAFLPLPPSPGWQPKFGLPVFIKANLGGSSLDMHRAETPEALLEGLADLHGKGQEVLVEALVPGVEITCAVLGDEPLPPILIRPRAGGYFDFASKYQPGGAEEICPAPVSATITRAVCDAALAAHRALGLRGVSRADFMVAPDGTPWILEVNTLPGMTQTSLLPQSAAAAGYDFDALIARLIELGLRDCGAARTQGETA
ncbi:MAG: D-alanine--D-alanine ligase [Desulfovibrionaceae bacterium]